MYFWQDALAGVDDGGGGEIIPIIISLETCWFEWTIICHIIIIIKKNCWRSVWSFRGCYVAQGGRRETSIKCYCRLWMLSPSAKEVVVDESNGRFHWRCAWDLLSGSILLLLQSSCGLGQFNVSFLENASNRFAIAQCDWIDSTPVQGHSLHHLHEVLYWDEHDANVMVRAFFFHEKMERLCWTTTTTSRIRQLTAILCHMLSFRVPPGHIPVRWQMQTMIPWWEICAIY